MKENHRDKEGEVEISYFRNVWANKPLKNICLLEWLNGYPWANDIVYQIRKETERRSISELKKKLPAITPSGVFTIRNEDSLIKHSGYIAIDLDNCNPVDVKQTLSDFPYTRYAGLSVSGRGVWALIPIKYPHQHYQHFEALRADLEEKGLIVDPSGKDICRLRFYSCDIDPVINLDARVYSKLAPASNYHDIQPPLVECDALYFLLEKIQNLEVDITAHYVDWLKIGGTLASIFGESGRSMYHSISRFYPHYTPDETDAQYSACIRNKPGYGSGMIFSIAKKYGILLKNN